MSRLHAGATAAAGAVVARAPLWVRLRPWVTGFDVPLLLAVAWLAGIGLLTMYSVGFDHGTRFADHGRNMLIALAVMVIVAQWSPQRLMALALPVYGLGMALLVATALFGITKKGATRWLDLGVVIQPSEILKIGVPLAMAWWFQRREGQGGWGDWAVAALIVALPVVLVARHPDLGTALLIALSGLYVLFLAGMSWKLVLPALLLGALGIGAIVIAEPWICQEGMRWPLLREYQQQRVCTLLDPARDPLGRGFHIIQGMIAIGAGGLLGKGFMQGTQTHLEFIPERTTDFIFASLSEEFGLVGVLLLVAGLTWLILRGLMIAAEAPTRFARLLAGAVALNVFSYAFVNMGMVSGILTVVGVPLPFVSYGGTAMVSLGLGLGILMSVARSRRR